MTNNFLQLLTPNLTKKDISAAGASYASQLLAGDVDPLEAYLRVRALEGAVKTAVSELKSAAIDEAEKYGRDDSKRYGVKFAVRGGSEQWDYSHDADWNELKKLEKEVVKERKAREGFLRSLKKEMVDPETGEIVEPAKLMGYGAMSLALTFPKE